MSNTLAFDFNGVLDQSPDDYRINIDPDDLDFTPLWAALEKGWAVAVVTAARPAVVARALGKAGFKVYVDNYMELEWWDGGKDGDRVLVTNRKISATAYIDDRAVNFRWRDTPLAGLWKSVAVIQAQVSKARHVHKMKAKLRWMRGQRAA